MFVTGKIRFLYLLFWVSFFPNSHLSLQTPFPGHTGIFADTILPRIDIIIPADSLADLLAEENYWRNYHYHATFVFNNGSIIDTIENIGFRIRGNTSRKAAKKSFKISFNTYVPGRKFHGVEKLNLNGEHNDPTVIRSKVCWNILEQMEVPASRANHVELYINNDYFGLYINVEHIDENFVNLRFGNKRGNLYKCLWPATLEYLGDDPDLYKFKQGNRRTYTLKTNTEADDYTDLVHFIDVLNNTPAEDFQCELEKVFDVDTYLKAFVFDILSGHWDDLIYGQNNFYLYHNTETGKFEYIPYDLDNTLGIDWLGQDWARRNINDWVKHGVPRPLYWKLMENQTYRHRISFYFDKYLNEVFNLENLFPRIDFLRALIDDSALNDPYRPLDYDFSYQDFVKSYDYSLPTSHTPIGLKPYIKVRHNYAKAQLKDFHIKPIIRNIHHNSPNQIQDIFITAIIEDDNNIDKVEVCFSLTGSQDYNCISMYDDGLHNDGEASDSQFGVIIPSLSNQSDFYYYVRATDIEGNESRKPFCDNFNIAITPSIVPLAINELMASNNHTIADEAGEYDDWVEIFNYGDEAVYLGDKYLSDNLDFPDKWQFPDIWIDSQQYLLIWTDKDEEQGSLHTNFKLKAGGEFIGFFSSEEMNYAIIDGVKFNQQETDVSYGKLPDGNGFFQRMVATPEAANAPIILPPPNKKIPKAVAYPNPFHDHLTVDVTNPSFANYTITLFDILGRKILTSSGKSIIPKEISTLSLERGVYFLVISTRAGSTIVKNVFKY